MSVARTSVIGLALLIGVGACAHHPVVDDGTSLSYGWSRTGVLINPARLPARGVGYHSPPRWEHRGLRYGTDEMVSMLVWLGRELDRAHPGASFAVADLSLRGGGPSSWHRSHQHGRDADVVFLTRNRAGKTVRAQSMRHFDADGSALGPMRTALSTKPDVYFDDARNWTLVKLLLDNPIAEIQYVFVSDDLKQRLIEYAEEAGEPQEMIERAGYLLHQPSDSAPHSDHFHVRILCAVSDLGFGCRDSGAIRWVKKVYKYERRTARAGATRMLSFLTRQQGLLLHSLGGLPARGL